MIGIHADIFRHLLETNQRSVLLLSEHIHKTVSTKEISNRYVVNETNKGQLVTTRAQVLVLESAAATETPTQDASSPGRDQPVFLLVKLLHCRRLQYNRALKTFIMKIPNIQTIYQLRPCIHFPETITINNVTVIFYDEDILNS